MTTPADAPPAVVVKTPAKKPAAKPTIGERLQVWVPDPRWAHPVAGVLWLYALSIAVTRPGYALPPLLLVLVVPVGIVLSVARSRRTWPERDYGDDVAHSMAWLGGVASVMAGGWLVYAAFTSPWRSLAYLVLAGLFCGGWYAVLRTGAPKVKQQIADERAAAEVELAIATWRDLLKAAGIGLKVADIQSTRAGFVIGVEPVDDTSPVSFATLTSKASELTVKAAAVLARQGVSVRDGDIRFEPTEVAHVHLIHVCTKHVLAEVVEYVPFEGAPGTIADDLDFALFEDGAEVTECYAGEMGGSNGKIVGATGSGKSRLVNSQIGRIGECSDVLVGVVASSKLVPAVYPWIKPWLEGKSPKPALDFVGGQDPQEVLVMLAAIYQIVCGRNDALSNEATHVPTPREPAIVCYVEEAGDMAGRTGPNAPKIETHDGQTVGFSQLVHMILRQDRSAQVSLKLLNQTDLYGALGEFGPEIARNTPYRICLKTLAPQDGTSVLPGLGAWGDTAKLRNNSMLVQPSIDEPRVMPAKAYNLGGALIEPVATRNGQWRPELEPDLVDALGEVWTGRWDASRLPELAAAAARDRLRWPVGRLEDDVDIELRQMLAHEATGSPEETPMNAEPDPLGMPDADAAIAELNAISAQPAIVLPEPLQSVLMLLRSPQAPTDFIGTRQLAVLLGRVPGDASDDDITKAAAALGREMAAVDDELRTVQVKAVRGYDIPALKKTAARIAKGMQ